LLENIQLLLADKALLSRIEFFSFVDEDLFAYFLVALERGFHKGTAAIFAGE
jgi:hypothetical protein